MSDRMHPLSFARLMARAMDEARTDQRVFGVPLRRFAGNRILSVPGGRVEAPFGPAAGPHTQLAQNILAAYAAGARFFELKTVQTLDGEDLRVAKPCIAAADEGYNCEWSTELRVSQAFDEYVKAWYAIKLLSREWALGAADGFVFNLSVGYDFAGIRSEKIDRVIEGLREARDTPVWRECEGWARENLAQFRRVDAAFLSTISSCIVGSVTLSTLHGCPAREIEQIAAYLLREKGLHTFVKCNPTLLGYSFTRQTLDALGFDASVFDEFHFRDDLQYADAVPMLRRLMALSDEQGVAFGVKLTNTLPVTVCAGELPAEEMYLSGRALFPLAIALAQKLSHELDGTLRISYSGGADARNIVGLFQAGVWPITVATTLLKPGGYARLSQMAQQLEDCACCPTVGVDSAALDALVRDSKTDPAYRKSVKPTPPRKRVGHAPRIDCGIAPCRDGCPIGQDIPAYLRLAEAGEDLRALAVILERNPLPFVTGTICPHRCETHCTRAFYEAPIDVRAVKRAVAERAFAPMLRTMTAPEPTHGRVAVVGGGAAGISCAFFLARAGWKVTVLEQDASPGGVIRRVIPSFRIEDTAIDRDLAFAYAMGVTVRTNTRVESLGALRAEGFDRIVLAIGAAESQPLTLESGEAVGALDFLADCKAAPNTLSPGRDVVVIGGGNTAMDTARAAVRLSGVERVSIVYRRTRRDMPADEEEWALAVAEGVRFCELLSPVGWRDGVLTCREMTMGAPDASGRRRPIPTEVLVSFPADTVIAAVGERVDSTLYARNGLALDTHGRAAVDPETLESSVAGVYVIGDGNHGPATVVEAIADAAKAARAITGTDMRRYDAENRHPDVAAVRAKKGVLATDGDARTPSERCLQCATVCECCVEVCPNRANVAIRVNGAVEILHLDDLCNECGNCATFCPYEGAPYRDLFTLFGSAAEFRDSVNAGFLPLGGSVVRVRTDGEPREGDLASGDVGCPTAIAALMREVLEHHAPLIRSEREERR